jgi:hypothetical protein
VKFAMSAAVAMAGISPKKRSRGGEVSCTCRWFRDRPELPELRYECLCPSIGFLNTQRCAT